jgi:hypothetical protein
MHEPCVILATVSVPIEKRQKLYLHRTNHVLGVIARQRFLQKKFEHAS